MRFPDEENFSIDGTTAFLSAAKSHQRYVWVMSIFLLIAYYNFSIIPSKKTSASELQGSTMATEQPTLNNKYPEKIYEGVFQSQQGDIFRVGLAARVIHPQRIEIFLQSALNERVRVGELNFLPSMVGEYKELIFSVPGQYRDVVVRLDTDNPLDLKTWNDTNIFIYSFFITRIEVKNEADIHFLTPTIFGLSQIKEKVFFLTESRNKQSNNPEWLFQADGDFIEDVTFFGSSDESSPYSYAFKLFQFNTVSKKKAEELREVSFSKDSLNAIRLPSGNYRIRFDAPLERGKWYIISFSQTNLADHKGSFQLVSLKPENEIRMVSSVPDLSLSLHSFTRHENGSVLLDYARLEDLGKIFSYSFSFQEKNVDFINLFAASQDVQFDSKSKLVKGKRKTGEFFVYKFDTLYPFEQFALKAEQNGDVANEIRLEYSFDNAFWQTIEFTQKKGGSQKFFFSIPGNNKNSVIYVRVSYNGEEKKTGSFALKSLSVNAAVQKPIVK